MIFMTDLFYVYLALSLGQPLTLLSLKLWGLMSREQVEAQSDGVPRQAHELHTVLYTVAKGSGN